MARQMFPACVVFLGLSLASAQESMAEPQRGNELSISKGSIIYLLDDHRPFGTQVNCGDVGQRHLLPTGKFFILKASTLDISCNGDIFMSFISEDGIAGFIKFGESNYWTQKVFERFKIDSIWSWVSPSYRDMAILTQPGEFEITGTSECDVVTFDEPQIISEFTVSEAGKFVSSEFTINCNGRDAIIRALIPRKSVKIIHFDSDFNLSDIRISTYLFEKETEFKRNRRIELRNAKIQQFCGASLKEGQSEKHDFSAEIKAEAEILGIKLSSNYSKLYSQDISFPEGKAVILQRFYVPSSNGIDNIITIWSCPDNIPSAEIISQYWYDGIGGRPPQIYKGIAGGFHFQNGKPLIDCHGNYHELVERTLSGYTLREDEIAFFMSKTTSLSNYISSDNIHSDCVLRN